MSEAGAFPFRSNDDTKTPALLIERGFSLRHAATKDLPRLRLLYASTRAEEMANVPWPASTKQQFLDQQFELQHRHYLSHYPDCDFLVIEQAGTLQGRYYLQRAMPDHLLVDISLMPEHRGGGIGRALIEASQREAHGLGRGMSLHVLKHNPCAKKLYEKLGFAVCDDNGSHWAMCWKGPRETSS